MVFHSFGFKSPNSPLHSRLQCEQDDTDGDGSQYDSTGSANQTNPPNTGRARRRRWKRRGSPWRPSSTPASSPPPKRWGVSLCRQRVRATMLACPWRRKAWSCMVMLYMERKSSVGHWMHTSKLCNIAEVSLGKQQVTSEAQCLPQAGHLLQILRISCHSTKMRWSSRLHFAILLYVSTVKHFKRWRVFLLKWERSKWIWC